jgi:hypothetical protein
MWPFRTEPTKAELEGHQRVSVLGSAFVIRKVNPLLDFSPDKMPQIFAANMSRRKPVEEGPSLAASQRALREMQQVVEVGLVEPSLIPVGKGELRGKEGGITVEDVFRDLQVGVALYWAIIAHSLNQYKGVRGQIFLELTRRRLYTSWLRSMAAAPAESPTATASSV